MGGPPKWRGNGPIPLIEFSLHVPVWAAKQPCRRPVSERNFWCLVFDGLAPVLITAMAPRHLINEDGKPFEDGELGALSKELDTFGPAARKNFRDANARAIARHSALRMLIVAGP